MLGPKKRRVVEKLLLHHCTESCTRKKRNYYDWENNPDSCNPDEKEGEEKMSPKLTEFLV